MGTNSEHVAEGVAHRQRVNLKRHLVLVNQQHRQRVELHRQAAASAAVGPRRRVDAQAQVDGQPLDLEFSPRPRSMMALSETSISPVLAPQERL